MLTPSDSDSKHHAIVSDHVVETKLAIERVCNDLANACLVLWWYEGDTGSILVWDEPWRAFANAVRLEVLEIGGVGNVGGEDDAVRGFAIAHSELASAQRLGREAVVHAKEVG